MCGNRNCTAAISLKAIELCDDEAMRRSDGSERIKEINGCF
jgi:hypothetical protein